MAYPGWKLASRFLCCGGRREKRQRQTHKYTDTHRHPHTTPHTHTIRLRAHCSSVHTPILSPIFGTRFAQTNTAFWGREDGGRGGSFLFCFLLPISCPPPPQPLQGGWVHGKLKDTLGMFRRPLSPFAPFAALLSAADFIYFCLWKDKLLSWLYILCFHIPLYLWLC